MNLLKLINKHLTNEHFLESSETSMAWGVKSVFDRKLCQDSFSKILFRCICLKSKKVALILRTTEHLNKLYIVTQKSEKSAEFVDISSSVSYIIFETQFNPQTTKH